MRILPARDEVVVVCKVVACEGGGRHEAFEIEIETVDVLGAERARFARSDPGGSLRAKGAPQEVSEVLGHGTVFEVVVGWVAAADGEEDFLAVGAARLDAFGNAGAAGAKAGFVSIIVGVEFIFAGVG